MECTSTTLGTLQVVVLRSNRSLMQECRTTPRCCQERIVAHNCHSSSSFANTPTCLYVLHRCRLLTLTAVDVFHTSHRAPSRNPTGYSKPLALFPSAPHLQSWQLRSHRVEMVLCNHGRSWSLPGRGLSSEGGLLWQLCSAPVETRIGPRAHFRCHLRTELSCCGHQTCGLRGSSCRSAVSWPSRHPVHWTVACAESSNRENSYVIIGPVCYRKSW